MVKVWSQQLGPTIVPGVLVLKVATRFCSPPDDDGDADAGDSDGGLAGGDNDDDA